MHGKPGAVLLVAKRDHPSTPDFSGPSFLSVKKKMIGHGSDPHDESCPVCGDAEMEDDSEGIGEPLTTDTDEDESYESKVAKMKGMAQEMLKISDELAKASETQAEQSEQLRKMSDDQESEEAEG